MNAKKDITKDYNITTISLNIREFKHKYSNEMFYIAKKYKRSKRCNTLLEAQKYIDLKCIEHEREQLYNSFRMV